MFYVEIRKSVRRRGPPILIPLEEVYGHTGFRSVFAYPPDVADMIREQASTKGLRGNPIYADTLFVDFDNVEPGAFDDYLREQGLAFTKWDSGGRSIHLHIDLIPCEGIWVPDGCKAWMKQHAPHADMSIYHQAAVYRLPGTYHRNNPGHRKTLLETHPGKPLELPKPKTVMPMPSRASDQDSFSKYFSLLSQSVGEGGRRPHAWKLATLAAEAGVGFEKAVQDILWWNSTFAKPPHADTDVYKQIESAYRRAGNST